jgi:hypothetical protein
MRTSFWLPLVIVSLAGATPASAQSAGDIIEKHNVALDESLFSKPANP